MKAKYICATCGSGDVIPNRHDKEAMHSGLSIGGFCHRCQEEREVLFNVGSRFIRIGQRVFCADSTFDFGRVMFINNKAEDAEIDDDSIVYVKMDNGVSENECTGNLIFTIDPYWSWRLGREVCWAHDIEDISHYIPSLDDFMNAAIAVRYAR